MKATPQPVQGKHHAYVQLCLYSNEHVLLSACNRLEAGLQLLATLATVLLLRSFTVKYLYCSSTSRVLPSALHRLIDILYCFRHNLAGTPLDFCDLFRLGTHCRLAATPV